MAFLLLYEGVISLIGSYADEAWSVNQKSDSISKFPKYLPSRCYCVVDVMFLIVYGLYNVGILLRIVLLLDFLLSSST